MKFYDNILQFVSLLILSVYSIDCQAQTSFYVTPKIGASMNFTSVKGYKDFTTTFLPPYSVGRNYNFWKKPTLTLGLAVGMKSQDQRHRIELSYERSAISYRSEVVYRPYKYAEDSVHIINPMINEKIQRLHLNYSFRLTKKTDQTSFWINASSGITMSSMVDLKMGKVYSNFHLDPYSRLNHILFQAESGSNINMNFGLGFDVDFYNKQKYILSLSFQYIQGIGKIQKNNIHINYTKFDTNFGNPIIMNHATEIFSRGSGFQLTLSRRIQFFTPKSKLEKDKK